jgi:hypothetical protein
MLVCKHIYIYIQTSIFRYSVEIYIYIYIYIYIFNHIILCSQCLLKHVDFARSNVLQTVRDCWRDVPQDGSSDGVTLECVGQLWWASPDGAPPWWFCGVQGVAVSHPRCVPRRWERWLVHCYQTKLPVERTVSCVCMYVCMYVWQVPMNGVDACFASWSWNISDRK